MAEVRNRRSVRREIMSTHVDFLRLRRTTKINLYIPVEFSGHDDCPGLRRGGVLTVVRPEVELIVTAGEIPENISVDLSGLDINDAVTISMVTLPEGTKATIDRDFIVASVSAPSGLQSDEDEEEGAPDADEVPTVDDTETDIEETED